LTDEQLERILRYQREHKLKFGEAAIALGFLNREDVIWALSQQFQYPYSSEPTSNINPELVVATQPFSDNAELFRDVRSQLMLNAPTTKRALAIVSQDRGDGKSIFAANLAVAFSQLGAKTLLIDADLRAPRQQELLRCQPASGGLSSVLSGRSSVTVVRPMDAFPTLYFLPVGIIPPNPLELLQKPALGILLNDVINRFDHVIVDTPAATHGYDSRVIAATCGSALIVGRPNVTRLADLEQLHRTISKNCQVMGVVLNQY
jgi:protein-tyrosine kinase